MAKQYLIMLLLCRTILPLPGVQLVLRGYQLIACDEVDRSSPHPHAYLPPSILGSRRGTMCQQQPHSPQALEVDGNIQQTVEVASGSDKGWTAAGDKINISIE